MMFGACGRRLTQPHSCAPHLLPYLIALVSASISISSRLQQVHSSLVGLLQFHSSPRFLEEVD